MREHMDRRKETEIQKQKIRKGMREAGGEGEMERRREGGEKE